MFLPKLSEKGPINGVSGSPITNATFTNTLADVLHKPSNKLFKVPESLVYLMMGEGYWTLTQGQPVLPEVAKKYGYQWEYENIEDALKNIVLETTSGSVFDRFAWAK